MILSDGKSDQKKKKSNVISSLRFDHTECLLNNQIFKSEIWVNVFFSIRDFGNMNKSKYILKKKKHKLSA